MTGSHSKIFEKLGLENKYLREYVLCSLSFLSFVIRHCWIQDRASKKPIRFLLWPGQRKCVPLFLKHKRIIILKARQIGLTWLTAAYALWRCIFNANELIVIISAKEELAIEFLDRVKYMFDRLPSYLKPKVYKRTNTELSFGYEEKDNQGNTVLKGLGSIIKSLPSTPEAGQSKTISLLVMDETAINRYNREIWSAASPTLEHANGDAIIISNPTKIGFGWPWTRRLYVASMKGENSFHRIFLDPFAVPSRGKDFVPKVMMEEGLTEEDRIMQYPLTEEEAISSMVGTYFGGYLQKFKEVKGHVGNLKVEKKKLRFERNKKGILEIWRYPKRGWRNRYCIGSDVGEGLGGSYSVAYVLDRVFEQFVARMRSNRIEADIWAELLIYLGVYFGRCMIGAERMGPGITTVQHLKRSYHNNYTRIKPGRTSGEYTREIGWTMGNEAKRLMAGDLKRYYRAVANFIPCGILLDESSTFVEYEGGTGLGAEEGAFDDCVDAAGITLQVSKSVGRPKMIEEAQEEGWREILFGHKNEGVKPYDIASI